MPPGDPASGEDALLSVFLFVMGPNEARFADGTPIVVSIVGLEALPGERMETLDSTHQQLAGHDDGREIVSCVDPIRDEL